MKKNAKRKNNKGYQQKQKYLNLFFKNSKKSLAIHSLKSIEDLATLREIQNSVAIYARSIKKDIEGRLFPKDFKELCSTQIPFIRPLSLNSELVWFCSYAIKYFDKIKWFLKKKKEFEQDFLLGKWSKCDDLLVEVKSKLGVSLWYYEATFLLYEYWDKRKDSIMMMSDCLEATREMDVNYLQSLVYKLHQRTTTNISPFKFDEDLDALYKQNKTMLHEDFYRYFLFRLNFFNNISQEELSYNMMFESVSSLVDRYLMAVDLLKAAAIKDKLDQNLKSRAIYLFSKTNDEELNPLITMTYKSMKESYYDDSFIEILDSYYKGNYQKVIELCKSYILNNASNFDIYVIYGRCLIYMGKEYQDIAIQNSTIPANKLSKLVYNTLIYRGNRESIYSLCQMNKNLYGFHLAAAMHIFVKHEMNESANEKIKALWCNRFDPEYAKSVYFEKIDAINYINNYKKNRESLTCRITISELNDKEFFDESVCYNVKQAHNASILMLRKEYDIAYQMWKCYYDASNSWLPNRQKAVRNMILCLFLDGKIEKAISLYVDYLLSDPSAILKTDTEIIIKHLQNNLYENIHRNIDLAIFMGLNCKDSVDKSFILLEFCEQKGVEKPSELIANLDEPKDRQEAFFAIMNDDETLRHYFNIPSLKERLNERLKILNYLISLDTKNKDEYLQMQKEVEDALLVYRVSSNLNEGKIYANDQAILKYKLNEIDGLYKRFVQLFSIIFNDKKSFYVIDFSNSAIFYSENDDEGEFIKSKTSINGNGIYEVFYSLYEYIRDKFLYSEFGLVAYLSTRVRHGELESKLRPELDQRNLILQMKDNNYQNTSYWKEQYNLNSNENYIVNNALTKFSRGFDQEVVTLIKEKLQIYDKEKKPNGLFRYDTDETELSVMAMQMGIESKDKGKEEFCKLMLNWLWRKTESCLSSIRNFISGEFTEHINSLFDNLKYDLRPEVLPAGHVQSFLQSTITEASSVIASRIKNIECWFNITGTKLEDVDMKQLTYQVFNNIKTAYPQIKTSGKPHIEGESFKIKSAYVLHYADLLRNLITNMFKHGEPDSKGIKNLTLNFNIMKDRLALHFENDVKIEQEESLNKKFIEKLSDNASYYNSEGGSGIAKAKKILKSDLQSDKNRIMIKAKRDICTTEVIIYTNKLKAHE